MEESNDKDLKFEAKTLVSLQSDKLYTYSRHIFLRYLYFFVIQYQQS